MYQEKHHGRSRRIAGKSIALPVSLLLIVCMTIVGTIAFLIDTDGPLENIFKPSKVTTEVVEIIDGFVKTNVKISNTGDTEAYIRAAVVITWKDAAGNVYGQAPVDGKDYEITWSGIEEDSWKKGIDGFYYHLAPVAAKTEDDDTDMTSVLFTDCYEKEGANKPEGYFLNVEIIASGIQSVPTSVVEEVWSSGVSGVNSDATLVIKEPTTGGEG